MNHLDWDYAPAPESAAIGRLQDRYQLYVGGRFVDGRGDDVKSINPATMVVLRPYRSARCPRKNPAIAMPPIVAYWNVPAAVSDRWNVLTTSGMMMPTESVVIANIANIT